MEKTMEALKEKLKSTGFKITPQRRAIIEVLLENENSHMSSEEIYDKVRVSCPEIGLATVYRTMQLLDEINGISKLNLDDGCIRYEINVEGDDSHHHHHLICKECGNIIEVREDLLDAIEERVENTYNFRIKNHDLKFYGTCVDCLEKEK
ncbi:Fur family transcriptional regulator [Peptostreptococcus faecalis]|uniref:Fur family transcriptional regulator n=1 Tax=Peptostreptococcus faecalis TaxID=2045015 RepID=UPI000C7A08BF|nr:Fur family transcriptional regulator [Peptostreptococcus faecalis]